MRNPDRSKLAAYILFALTEPFTDDILIDWYKSVWFPHRERLSRNHMTGNWLIMEMNGLAQIWIFFIPSSSCPGSSFRRQLGSLEEELDRQIAEWLPV